MLTIRVCVNQCSWWCATWGPSMLLLSSTDGLCWLLQACKQARNLQPAPPSKNRLHPQRYIYTCKPQPWFSFTFWSQFSVSTSQVGSFLNKHVCFQQSRPGGGDKLLYAPKHKGDNKQWTWDKMKKIQLSLGERHLTLKVQKSIRSLLLWNAEAEQSAPFENLPGNNVEYVLLFAGPLNQPAQTSLQPLPPNSCAPACCGAMAHTHWAVKCCFPGKVFEK